MPHPPAPATMPTPATQSPILQTLTSLLLASLFSLLFILTFTSTSTSIPSPPQPHLPLFSTNPTPPVLAYLLSGTYPDRLLRLLHSVYHPRNLYLLRSGPTEKDRVEERVREVEMFREVGNVFVVGNVGFENDRGGSGLAEVVRGAAALARLSGGWDWFLNLEDGDYPLVPQDDLLHIMAYLPRDLNFVQHTSHFDAKESHQLKRVIVDPELYTYSKFDIYYVTQKRELPDAFRLFTGSSRVILSRKFVEFCISGTDNLPRTLLMYLANSLSARTKYFQTVLCNTKQFNNTVVNANLHFMPSWNASSVHEPPALGSNDLFNITESGAAFGSHFSKDDPVLDRIDKELLDRVPGRITPGGWCVGSGEDPCAVLGEANVLRPGIGARRVEKMMIQLLSSKTLPSEQCIWE